MSGAVLLCAVAIRLHNVHVFTLATAHHLHNNTGAYTRARAGYYKQKGLENVPDDTRVLQLVEDVCAGVPKAPDDTSTSNPQASARQLLSRFNFPAARWNDMVVRLSGGERRRLQLLQVLAAAPNFLVLGTCYF
jgi:ATPase subunit of ABC transporter with duplicated ATPase domains